MRDLKSDITVRQSMPFATRLADDVGTSIDRIGFESVTYLFHFEQLVDGIHTFSLEESDDDVNWSAVANGDLIGMAPVQQSTDASPTEPTHEGTLTLGYIGGLRYSRPKVVVTGAPSLGAAYSVDVILSHAHQRPVS